MPRGRNDYEQAKQGGRLWTPSVWTGDQKLAAWWDFSDYSQAITVVSGNLSSIADKSGKGNTLTQTTSGNRPPWSAAGWVDKSVPSIVPTGSQSLNFTTVLTYSGGSGLSASAIAYHSGSGVQSLFSVLAGVSAPLLRFNAGKAELLRNFSASLLTSAAGSCPAGANIIGCDTATNYCAVWTNGTLITNSTNPGFTTAVNCLLVDNGTAFFTGGPFGEIIFGLIKWTNKEHQLVDGYLAWKWNQVGLLVASHPFKKRPPLIGD